MRRREKTGRTVDAVLDELGIDVRRADNLNLTGLEERCRRSLVEQPVVEQAEVLQAIPLRPGLGVLPNRLVSETLGNGWLREQRTSPR